MTLAIVSIPPCGFGNRLLYYFNLRQESYKKKLDFFCVPWQGYQLFEGDLLGQRPIDNKYEILDFCLGEKFYLYNDISTREVFKLKIVPDVPEGMCAIHFRGTDFFDWNPDSILNFHYYCDSIERVKDEVTGFILFTDDQDLESYKKVKRYLSDKKIQFYVGENTHNRNNFVHDFSVMSECDYIISSPSTYNICAGFIGKQKKIIPSLECVKSRVEKEDKFWSDLYDGGNKNYKIWDMI